MPGVGFEPTTCGLQNRCSTAELTRHINGLGGVRSLSQSACSHGGAKRATIGPFLAQAGDERNHSAGKISRQCRVTTKPADRPGLRPNRTGGDRARVLDELRISNHHVDRPHKVALRDTLRALCAKWRLRCTVTFLCRTSKSGLRNSSSRSSDSSSVIARLDHTQGEADFVLLLAQLFALVYRLPVRMKVTLEAPHLAQRARGWRPLQANRHRRRHRRRAGRHVLTQQGREHRPQRADQAQGLMKPCENTRFHFGCTPPHSSGTL